MNSYKYIILSLLLVDASNAGLLIARGQTNFRKPTSTSFFNQLKKSMSHATSRRYIKPLLNLGHYIFGAASVYGPVATLLGYACYNDSALKKETACNFNQSKYKLRQNNIY